MLSSAKPGMETKISLKEFERLVGYCFGNTRFSAFQLKAVFLLHALDLHKGIDKSFIPLRDFKDLYYPGRLWKTDFHQT